MIGNLHAIILLLVPVITLAACILFQNHRISPIRILCGLICGPILAVSIGATAYHACTKGQPFTQWLIPGICLTATLIFLGNQRGRLVRWVWAAILIIIMFKLSHHYADIVHGPDYVGNPQVEKDSERFLAKDLARASEAIALIAEDDPNSYAPGWLSESPLLTRHGELLPRHGEPELIRIKGERRHVLPIWHTLLTGLYSQKIIVLELWYPGGPLKDAAKRLEYRVR